MDIPTAKPNLNNHLKEAILGLPICKEVDKIMIRRVFYNNYIIYGKFLNPEESTINNTIVRDLSNNGKLNFTRNHSSIIDFIIIGINTKGLLEEVIEDLNREGFQLKKTKFKNYDS